MLANRPRRNDAGHDRAHRAVCLAAVAAGGIWAAASLMTFVGREASGPDAESTRRTIEAILSERNDTLRHRLSSTIDAANSPSGREESDARARWTRSVGTSFAAPGDGVLIVSRDGALVAGVVDGQPAAQGHLRALSPVLGGMIRDAFGDGLPQATATAAPTVLTDGSRLVSAVAAPSDPERATVAVAFRMIDAGRLAQLGATIGVEGLRFVAGLPAADTPGVAIPGAKGGTLGYLTWSRSDPPASPMQWLLLLLQLCGAGGLIHFGVAGWRQSRTSPAMTAGRRPAGAIAPSPGWPDAAALAPILRDALAHAHASGESFALHLIGFDDSRSADAGNDETVGSAALAERIAALVREDDSIVRLGGGRLAVLQAVARTPAHARVFARRIVDAVIGQAPLAAGEGRIGASIGIALAPQDATTPETLLQRAETALARARQGGGYRFCFYDPSLDALQQRRKAIEDDLCASIMREQLTLAFQPLVLADGDTTTAVEALVRWRHPEKGPIPPSDFIPIAEERGLIDVLGEWVLRKACQEGRRWPGITVAVNVSPVQFRKPGFVDRVLRIVDETGFEPWRLELELTEGVVVDNEDAAEQAMMELRAAGIRLALDDFGTGYSSLIYLRRFAFDKIKIDKSFLDSMETTGESAILVHSVIHLGRALGLTVTAEGVETPEQHRFLQAAGCHQLQGYLFSRPVTAEEIDVRLGVSGLPLRRAAVA